MYAELNPEKLSIYFGCVSIAVVYLAGGCISNLTFGKLLANVQDLNETLTEARHLIIATDKVSWGAERLIFSARNTLAYFPIINVHES